MKKTRAQLDREIAQTLSRRAPKKTGRRAHSTVASGSSWDVAMDALMEHDPTRAATIVATIRREHGLSSMTPEFTKALAKAPKDTRLAFESAVGMVSKKSYDWDDFINGAAFGFWASPYMTEVENLAEEEGGREAYRALAPESGG